MAIPTKSEKMATDVASMLNALGTHNSKEFIAKMGNEHRTLQ